MIDSGDTAFILICTALVMLMTPGVGLFYGGLVRRKNFISMLARHSSHFPSSASSGSSAATASPSAPTFMG